MASVYIGPLGSTSQVQGATPGGSSNWNVREISASGPVAIGDGLISVPPGPGPYVMQLPLIDASNVGGRVLAQVVSGTPALDLVPAVGAGQLGLVVVGGVAGASYTVAPGTSVVLVATLITLAGGYLWVAESVLSGGAITSDDVTNNSSVAGATVTDALDALLAAIPPPPSGAGYLRTVPVYASGNYTPSADCNRIVASLTAGGGGGARSFAAGTTISTGGGGGGGGTVEFSALVTPSVPIPVTIGGGGVRGPAPNTNGTAGTNSLFLGRGATGGAGGNVTGDPAQPPVGLPAAANGTTGAMVRRGGDGGVGAGIDPADIVFQGGKGDDGNQHDGSNASGGSGGASRVGPGGRGATLAGGYIGAPAYLATSGNRGGGGGGACASFDAADGAPGLLIVYEYS